MILASVAERFGSIYSEFVYVRLRLSPCYSSYCCVPVVVRSSSHTYIHPPTCIHMNEERCADLYFARSVFCVASHRCVRRVFSIDWIRMMELDNFQQVRRCASIERYMENLLANDEGGQYAPVDGERTSSQLLILYYYSPSHFFIVAILLWCICNSAPLSWLALLATKRSSMHEERSTFRSKSSDIFNKKKKAKEFSFSVHKCVYS